MSHYDLIVIGGGSGGLTATTIAARLGARVLLVDRERLGGDCLHDGCVPSKTLIASARLAHAMRTAGELGLEPVDVKVDLRKVMARVRAVQGSIGAHETPEVLRQAGAHVALGGARFVDANTIRIGESERATADRFIIATGSRAAAPPLPGLAETGFLDHVSLWKLESLPRRLAVLGGGPIGVEMGQALRRLGAEVTLVQKGSQLVAREEPEVAAHLTTVLRGEGIDVRLGVTVERVDRDGAEKWLTLFANGERSSLRVDEILVAVGRKPVLTSLGLDAAGIPTNDKGIVVDDHLRSSQPHIFAIGDCAGGPQFTHWAEYEARIATRNALFRGAEKRSMEVVPWVTFTDPEIARVGLTEAEAKERHGADVHVHRFEFARVDRAVTEGQRGGFIKVIVDGSEHVLGAHIIGYAAGEALSEWVLAMAHPRALKLDDIASAIHAYPTGSRVNRRVADQAFLEHGVSKWALLLGGRFHPVASQKPA